MYQDVPGNPFLYPPPPLPLPPPEELGPEGTQNFRGAGVDNGGGVFFRRPLSLRFGPLGLQWEAGYLQGQIFPSSRDSAEREVHGSIRIILVCRSFENNFLRRSRDVTPSATGT